MQNINFTMFTLHVESGEGGIQRKAGNGFIGMLQ